MKAYIMEEEEYNALDHYLTAGKFYDAGFWIEQSKERGDFGRCEDEDGANTYSLFELIQIVFIDMPYDELYGEKNFTEADAGIIQRLYGKLKT